MDFIPPQLLLTVVSALILLSALLSRVSHDARIITKTNKLNRQLIKAGRTHIKAKFSVVIQLNKKAESIFPLLDQLLDQQYKNLEVIVVIKHTAGKNARATLRRYQKSHSDLLLRLVSYKSRMTDVDIVRQFTNNSLVLSLSAEQRVSNNFFNHISIDEALDHPDVIMPKIFMNLPKTITGAVVADAVSRHSQKVVIDKDSLMNGVIYKRSTFISKKSTRLVTRLSDTAYLTEASSKNGVLLPTLSWKSSLIFFLGIAGFVYTMLSLRFNERLIVVGLIIVVYAGLYAAQLFGNKAYRFVEKLSLFLLSPLFLAFRVVSYALSILRTLKQLPRKKHA